jgi:hypothetical protein
VQYYEERVARRSERATGEEEEFRTVKSEVLYRCETATSSVGIQVKSRIVTSELLGITCDYTHSQR